MRVLVAATYYRTAKPRSWPSVRPIAAGRRRLQAALPSQRHDPWRFAKPAPRYRYEQPHRRREDDRDLSGPEHALDRIRRGRRYSVAWTGYGLTYDDFMSSRFVRRRQIPDVPDDFVVAWPTR